MHTKFLKFSSKVTSFLKASVEIRRYKMRKFLIYFSFMAIFYGVWGLGGYFTYHCFELTETGIRIIFGLKREIFNFSFFGDVYLLFVEIAPRINNYKFFLNVRKIANSMPFCILIVFMGVWLFLLVFFEQGNLENILIVTAKDYLLHKLAHYLSTDRKRRFFGCRRFFVKLKNFIKTKL